MENIHQHLEHQHAGPSGEVTAAGKNSLMSLGRARGPARTLLAGTSGRAWPVSIPCLAPVWLDAEPGSCWPPVMLRSARRLRAAFLLTSLVLVLFSGCRPSQSPAEAGIANKTLLVSIGAEAATLDPQLNTGSSERKIIDGLWQGLLQWNHDATGFLPAQAESWELSDDGLTYTFHLRPDLKWSNGEPVTADQFVASARRLMSPRLGSEMASEHYNLKNGKAVNTGQLPVEALGVSAPDAHTVVYQLEHRSVIFTGNFVGATLGPVYVPGILAKGEIDNPLVNWVIPGEVVTNGPFVLTEWKANQHITLQPNPHYYGWTRLKEVRFLSQESLDTQDRAYRAGQLHVTYGIPSHKIQLYAKAGDPALQLVPTAGLHFTEFNSRKPPFDNPLVRRAFSIAIDRQKFVDAVLRGGETPAYGVILPRPGGYVSEAVIPQNVALARQLLAEAGYPNGAGFPRVEYLYNTSDKNKEIAEALQQMWRAVLNVNVELLNQEWKVYLDSMYQGNYQIGRRGLTPGSPEPADFYRYLRSDSSINSGGFKNARYDALSIAAEQELDPVKATALFREMDAILLEEMPIIPLAFRTIARLVHPRVENWPTNVIDREDWHTVGFTPD